MLYLLHLVSKEFPVLVHCAWWEKCLIAIFWRSVLSKVHHLHAKFENIICDGKGEMKCWKKEGLDLLQLSNPTLRVWFSASIIAMNMKFKGWLGKCLASIVVKFQLRMCYRLKVIDLNLTKSLRDCRRKILVCLRVTLCVVHNFASPKNWYVNIRWGIQLPCKFLWVEHEGVESNMRVTLTRSTLKILCDLSGLGQNWGMGLGWLRI